MISYMQLLSDNIAKVVLLLSLCPYFLGLNNHSPGNSQ